MGSVIPELAAFGLAVAVTSPGSVVTMIVLLTMPAGLRRGIAFICGWLLAIGVLAVLMVFILHGQDFSSRHTTPSRAASGVEVAVGCLLLAVSARAFRRPREAKGPQSTLAWLARIERIHWSLCVAGWIGLLFAIGSAGFALGAFPYLAARADPTAVGIAFFVGSIFFTCAAALQLAQALMGGGWLDRLATAVQFAGTLFFNWTTFAGLNDALDTQERIHRVWAPDAVGSICFLVASYVAIVALCGSPWCRRRGDTPWRIAMLNMVGSVFFGISAITSFILPDTGEVLNADATNATTFLGAVCFLAGGLRLMPRLGRARALPAAG